MLYRSMNVCVNIPFDLKYYVFMKKLKIKSIFILFFLAGSLPSFSATSRLTLTSGNEELNAGFLWAKEKALSYVATGKTDPKTGVLYPYPCYKGSYPNNPESCLRDITHQVEAGHLLGLDVENFSMLKRFVQYGNNNQDDCRKHWPCWQLLFNGETSSYSPEVPSPFELAERSFEQYMWTGDNKWITDTEFSNFFQYTNTTLVNYLAPDADGVISLKPLLDNCNDGFASYWEFEDKNTKATKAADALGCQYQSYLGYAKILETNGNVNGANAFRLRAQKLKDEFETNWFIPSANRYVSCVLPSGVKRTEWSHEQSLFILLKRISDMGPRTNNYIDFVHSSTYNEGINIETTTYYPEAFYHHGANHIGWHWLLYGFRSRNDYPEVSFLAVRNTICGLMGVSADAPANRVITLGRLVNDVPWVQVDNIPVGANAVTVRHDGNTKTAVTNVSGVALTWEAQFYGEYSTVTVEGTPVTPTYKTINGKKVSCVDVPLAVGDTKIVIATVMKNPLKFVYLSDLDWATTTDASKIRKDVCQSGYAMTLLNPSDNTNTTFVKGIGMKNSQQLTYNLDKKYFLFASEIGLDIAKLGNGSQTGSVTFEVWADGVKAGTYTIASKSERKKIVLNVENVSVLKLVTVSQQYVDIFPTWADAKLYTEKTAYFDFSFINLTNESQTADQLLNSGEIANVVFNVANKGFMSSGSNTKLNCYLVGDGAKYATLNTPTNYTLGAVAANTNMDKAFSVSVSANTPKGTLLNFRLSVVDGNDSVEYFYALITPRPILAYSYDKVIDTQANLVNNLLEPGNTGKFVFNVANTGTDVSSGLRIVTESKSTYLTITAADFTAPVVAKGATVPVNVAFSVAANTPNNTKLSIKSTLYNGTEVIGSVERDFVTPSAFYEISFISLSNTGNQMSMLKEGSTSNVVMNVKNTGTKSGTTMTMKVTQSGDNHSVYSLGTPVSGATTLGVGANTTVSVPVTVMAHTATGTVVSLKFEASDATANPTSLEKRFVVGSVYCSDMSYTKLDNSGYAVNSDMHVMSTTPITVGAEKTVYVKGLGVHAPSILTFQMDKKFNTFSAVCGIDAAMTVDGSCVFIVYGDGVELKRTAKLLAGGVSEAISVPVTNVSVLKLEVTDGGNGINCDHADWANARLITDIPSLNTSVTLLDRAMSIVPTVINQNDPIRVRISSVHGSRASFTVFNELGRECYVTYQDIPAGATSIEILNANLGRGMYFLKMTDNEGSPIIGKFLVK